MELNWTFATYIHNGPLNGKNQTDYVRERVKCETMAT